MGFFDDILDLPGEIVKKGYGLGEGIVNTGFGLGKGIVNKTAGLIEFILNNAGNVVDTLTSPIFMIGIAIVAIVVLPMILKKD